MKQIKVVARGFDVSGNADKNNAMTDGIINVSFNEPITIEAGSRIALDKFLCHVTKFDTNLDDLIAYPDLAIEMSSLNLESFDSEKRGRRNVVAYFTVADLVPIQEDVGTFVYEAKTLSYLSINNEMDIDLGTIVFRVVDIKKNKGLKADYVSFNLLIA